VVRSVCVTALIIICGAFTPAFAQVDGFRQLTFDYPAGYPDWSPDGKPAITYIDWTDDQLMYIHASDADGSSWDASIIVDGIDTWNLSMTVIGQKPVICYHTTNSWNLKSAVGSF